MISYSDFEDQWNRKQTVIKCNKQLQRHIENIRESYTKVRPVLREKPVVIESLFLSANVFSQQPFDLRDRKKKQKQSGFMIKSSSGSRLDEYSECSEITWITSYFITYSVHIQS